MVFFIDGVCLFVKNKIIFGFIITHVFQNFNNSLDKEKKEDTINIINFSLINFLSITNGVVQYIFSCKF